MLHREGHERAGRSRSVKLELCTPVPLSSFETGEHYAVCVVPLGEYNVFVRDEENSHAQDSDTITQQLLQDALD